MTLPGTLAVVSVRATRLVDSYRAGAGPAELRWEAERLLAAIDKARTGRPRDPRTGRRA